LGDGVAAALKESPRPSQPALFQLSPAPIAVERAEFFTVSKRHLTAAAVVNSQLSLQRPILERGRNEFVPAERDSILTQICGGELSGRTAKEPDQSQPDRTAPGTLVVVEFHLNGT
jgi:hypothetical protein